MMSTTFPEYRIMNAGNDLQPPSRLTTKNLLPCVHRGDRIRSDDCVSCVKTKLDVFSCDVHGECTIDKLARGKNGRYLATCNSCSSRKPSNAIATKPKTRNLLFHVHPLRDSGVWRWNIEQLSRRMDQFNGKRVIGIALSPETVGESEVLSLFRSQHLDDVVVVNNDIKLREVATFDRMFGSVHSLDPDEITFYCHSKGIRHGMSDERGTTATDWAQVMYEVCLDYPEHVDEVLQQYSCAGPFKKVGRGFSGSKSQWHYSGSFFWFRNATLFAKNWKTIDRKWFGIEPYLSLHFDANDAGCLFMDGVVGTINDRNREQAMKNRHLDCYDWKFMKNHIKPLWEKWKKDHFQ